jgi:hypothetical protein
MTFQASDIGTNYDVGIATRPNLDGSTATLNCLNEDGAQVALSQVAFMFLAEEETEEAVDLIRKDQMIRLSTANVIDREFTLYPQATQGNWIGGETQRIFVDPSSYYQGRGLIWPSSSFVPSLPAIVGDIGALVDNLGNIFTSVVAVYGVMASGVSGGARGVAHAFRATSSAGTFNYIAFTATETQSTQNGNGVLKTPGDAIPFSIAVVNGTIYFQVQADVNLYSTQYQSTNALTAVATFVAMPGTTASQALLMGGYVGKDWVLAQYSGANANVRVFLSAAGTFADVLIPTVITVKAFALLGGVLYIAGSDGAIGYLITYDITAQQAATVVQLPGVAEFRMAAVQGAIFILAYNKVGPIANNSYLSIDMYLFSGSLQYIGHLNPFIVGLPPSLAYANPVSASSVAGYGQYALFAVGLSGSGTPQAMVCAYDVVHGTFFTAVDQFALTATGGIGKRMGLSAVSGADSNQRPPQTVEGRVASAGTLPAGTYTVVCTWTGAGGIESLASVGVSQVCVLNDALLSRGPSIAQSPPGATGLNFYLTAAPGGVNLGFIGSSGLGGTNTLTNPATGNGVNPPVTSTFGTAGDFTVYAVEEDLTYNQVAPAQTMRFNTFGYSNAGLSVLSGGGRVISSVIDFTSAAVKMYRQLVVTHEPIPAGYSLSVYVFLDRDGDNLTPDTTYKITNSTTGAIVTPLLVNAFAKKLVYIVDWPTVGQAGAASSHPISVAIQAATGWVFNIPMALSDSALVNGENPQEYCFISQDKQLDALAARNFIRQLWRQKGGQCIVTYGDGDSYNAIIQDIHITAKKFKTMNQPGDRKTRYEGKMTLKLAEDL